MNDPRRRAALESTQLRLREASLRFLSLRLCIFVNQETGAGPSVTIEDGLGCTNTGASGRFWVSEQETKTWWYFCFHDHEDLGTAAHTYYSLAREAGRLSRNTLVKALRLTGVDIQDDDLWMVFLFRLAWQGLPESPIQAFCDTVTKDGYGPCRPPAWNEMPLGLRSELSADPFTASDYAVSLLLRNSREELVQVLREVDHIAQRASSSVEGDEGSAQGVFRRSGKVFEITWEGNTFHLPDSQGLRHLHRLLEASPNPVSALELYAGVPNPSRRRSSTQEEKGTIVDNGLTSGAGTREKILDNTALRAVIDNLRILRSELEGATEKGDEPVAREIRAEISKLEERLSADTVAGARSRTFSDEKERARKAVGQNIRRALEKIGEQSESLNSRLHQGLDHSTGHNPAYRPTDKVTWILK